MKRLLHLVTLLAAATVLVAGAWALHRQEAESPTLAAARLRYERLSPDEKEQMRERYERYRSLSEDERRALADRARRMREEREQLHARLPAETRETISKLPPEKRREVLHDLFENEAREKGARIREKLPESWLERLEKAQPEERARFLNEFQRKARQRVSFMAIEKIGAKLSLQKDEIQRLKDLPFEERSQAILDLRKRLSTQDAAEFGLPEGITQAQWDQWQSLSPEQFFETMQRYRCEQEWRNAHRDAGAGAQGPERTGDSTAEQQQKRLWTALGDALRPRAEDVMKFSDLTSAERRKQVAVRRRDRVLAVLVDNQLVATERLDELRHMPEREFMDAMKDILPAPLPRWFRGHHDGDNDGRGRRGSDGDARSRRGGDEDPCIAPDQPGEPHPRRDAGDGPKREAHDAPKRDSKGASTRDEDSKPRRGSGS